MTQYQVTTYDHFISP